MAVWSLPFPLTFFLYPFSLLLCIYLSDCFLSFLFSYFTFLTQELGKGDQELVSFSPCFRQYRSHLLLFVLRLACGILMICPWISQKASFSVLIGSFPKRRCWPEWHRNDRVQVLMFLSKDTQRALFLIYKGYSFWSN